MAYVKSPHCLKNQALRPECHTGIPLPCGVGDCSEFFQTFRQANGKVTPQPIRNCINPYVTVEDKPEPEIYFAKPGVTASSPETQETLPPGIETAPPLTILADTVEPPSVISETVG
ncbi:MAG TPA: hypothetical protein VJR27_01150 [Candidatus Saccharimonadales bacterium]|nr:hypothetical protein [Candidatus Saccharimonadales bacterium]